MRLKIIPTYDIVNMQHLMEGWSAMLTKRFDPLKGGRLPNHMDPEEQDCCLTSSQISAMNGFWNSIELCFCGFARRDNKGSAAYAASRAHAHLRTQHWAGGSSVGSAAALQETDWLVPLPFGGVGHWLLEQVSLDKDLSILVRQ